MLRLLRSLLIAMMVIAVTTPATCLADPEFTSWEELTDKRIANRVYETKSSTCPSSYSRTANI
jgi:ABC-type Fe2+-enterobactin transport system substrate-binding protein